MLQDDRLETIRRRQGPVFGPSVDALVREIDACIIATERPAFVTLIETWPLEHPDPDALFHRLCAARDRLGTLRAIGWARCARRSARRRCP